MISHEYSAYFVDRRKRHIDPFIVTESSTILGTDCRLGTYHLMANVPTHGLDCYGNRPLDPSMVDCCVESKHSCCCRYQS